MGLAIETGFLADMLQHDAEGVTWFRDKLTIANTLLTDQGLPPHVEPETRGEQRTRAEVTSFPYSFMHHLRRAAAHAHLNPAWTATPMPEGADPTTDTVVESAEAGFDFHLLVHSDAEGFYVPIDFNEVIFDGQDRGLPGGMLGSSVRLLAELVAVAPYLGITLSDGALSDEEATRVNNDADEEVPLFRELMVWLALYEAARVSIANRTAIVFC